MQFGVLTFVTDEESARRSWVRHSSTAGLIAVPRQAPIFRQHAGLHGPVGPIPEVLRTLDRWRWRPRRYHPVTGVRHTGIALIPERSDRHGQGGRLAGSGVAGTDFASAWVWAGCAKVANHGVDPCGAPVCVIDERFARDNRIWTQEQANSIGHMDSIRSALASR